MGCGSSKTEETSGNAKEEVQEPIPQKQVKLPSNNPKENNTQNEKPSNNKTESGLEKFRLQCLERHNVLRKQHGAPPMKLVDEINEVAQKYAEHLGKTNKFEHSKGSGFGENLAGCTCKEGEFPEGSYITDMWYDEIKDYDFDNPGFSMNTGHFTQVVWKGSTELGIGIGYQKSGMCVVVANYREHGNMMGAFPQNVLPKQ